MRLVLLLLLLLTFTLNTAAQTSDGTQPLVTKTVTSNFNDNCSMLDVGHSFINERATTCTQSQSHFANGEIRFVDSGEGAFLAKTEYLGYELTSCACAQSATWTRTMSNVFELGSSFIRWRYKMYGRNADCSLVLKRDLHAAGCHYFVPCNCPEGQTCKLLKGSTLCEPTSPIAIDLDGDGLKLTGRADGVDFDLDGNGQRGRVPWLKEDAWLVLNDHEDGIVRDGQQLFGDQSAQPDSPAPNGYEALRVFDDNRDGKIDSNDGVWRLLGLWRDLNRNGTSEAGEVQSLTTAGVRSLSLDYKWSHRLDRHGNQLRYRARVEWANGRRTWGWDVWLTGR